MSLDIQQLQRYAGQDRATTTAARETVRYPPLDPHILIMGVGNSGEAVTLRMLALGMNDGQRFSGLGINNDRLAPRPVPVRTLTGTIEPLALTPRLILDGDNPRDQVGDYPLLQQRYARLLRGISVFETYPRAGAGGHGHPVISALDLDLHIDAVLATLRRAVRPLRGEPPRVPGQSDMQRLVAQQQQRQESTQEPIIVVNGGGGGAMGNVGHHFLPYLLRHTLAEQGITSYQLWGVLLGPRAFSGLTPFVRHNYRALLESLEHMHRHGQHRRYVNDLEIAMQQPPYDRVFVIDDPALPAEGARVTEAELEGFLDRAALSMYLLLRGTVWQTIASHVANDDGVVRDDGRLRYLNTVNAAMLGMDRAHVAEWLTTRLAQRLLEQFHERFAA